MYDFILLG